MAKYFSIAELSASDTARARGINNTPPPDIVPKMTALMDKVLDPIRERWGAPIQVNSGYRCTALNAAVGGVATSQHTKGEAADITTGTIGGNRTLFGIIQNMQASGEIEFDQLIDEKGYAWLHISYRAAGNRKQVLHL